MTTSFFVVMKITIGPWTYSVHYPLFCGRLTLIRLNINPQTSTTHTTGGATGQGIGDYSITGSFIVNTTSSSITFTNIDVIPTPGNTNGSFIPNYTVPFDGINFSGGGTPGNNIPMNLVGTFDGSTLHMNGDVYGNIANHYVINANVVSAPTDTDGDGVPDGSDICPGFDDNIDSDSDGIPDGCDIIQLPTPSAVIDAPHNMTYGIKCGDCHSYSMWWQYSPSTKSTNPNHSQISDRVCNSCHDGNNPLFPKGKSHSNIVAGSTKYTWDQYCIDCHDPHKQSQLDWIVTNSAELFLITGTIDNVANGSQANTTAISYSGAPVDNLTGDWTSRARWGKKSNNQNFDRGLILVVNTALAENTYQVLSATATTITVKGIVSSADSSKSFGLIYGQYIKSKIITPESGIKTVKFFDPNDGGLINIDPSGTGNTTGLCQVCHTKTTPFKNDGAAPTENHGSRVSGNCTTCHTCTEGFKSIP